MYGAILGDIIGSPFEFDRGSKTKDFDLFTRGCGFTDDSVMTVAVAEALLEAGVDADTDTIDAEMGKEIPQCRLWTAISELACCKRSKALWKFW